MAGRIVVVFDFNKTIVDVDNDDWVVDELGVTGLFNQLLPTMPWNSLMDRMMEELHSKGKTFNQIEQVLKHIPFNPRTISAIRSAYALGCDLRIISDANVFFIETVLNHLGIRDCFSEINTNPGFLDPKEGRLRIMPYHTSHDCNLCPPNMCKGKILRRIQDYISKEGKSKMIYLGDGAGDFCPSLKLNKGDYMMPRKDYPVWKLICENQHLLKAEIHEWSDGNELEQTLLGLVDRASMEEKNNGCSMFDNGLVDRASMEEKNNGCSMFDNVPTPASIVSA